MYWVNRPFLICAMIKSTCLFYRFLINGRLNDVRSITFSDESDYHSSSYLADKLHFRLIPNSRTNQWRNYWRIGVAWWRHHICRSRDSDPDTRPARPTCCVSVPVTSHARSSRITWRHRGIQRNDCLWAAEPRHLTCLHTCTCWSDMEPSNFNYCWKTEGIEPI